MTLTVSELTKALKKTLEGSFPSVSVQGEVSNCKLQASGHLYFTLKDAEAQIPAVMFRSESSQLTFELKNGDSVLVEGSLNVYAAAGRYQITVRRLEKQGLGALLLLLEERKKLIARRGWFRTDQKKKLPFLPKKIGVVTSPTGAAIRDIIEVLSRRGPGFQMILNPVKVQGDGAAEEIAKAIDFFNTTMPVDVMIVGRGGGSFEDLWCFNDEMVATAIFNSRIPIICAVGHETDHCIAEYVADVRAPTPSAAAELVMAEGLQLSRHIEQINRQLRQALHYRLSYYRQRLSHIIAMPVLSYPMSLLEPYMQRLDDTRDDLDRTITTRLQRLRLLLDSHRRLLAAQNPLLQIRHRHDKLTDYCASIDHAIVQHLIRRRHAIEALQRTLQAIDPSHLLKRGFSILFSEKDGSVITSASTMNIGDGINARLADGQLRATVNQVTIRE